MLSQLLALGYKQPTSDRMRTVTWNEAVVRRSARKPHQDKQSPRQVSSPRPSECEGGVVLQEVNSDTRYTSNTQLTQAYKSLVCLVNSF
jgi:hypothetical protein